MTDKASDLQQSLQSEGGLRLIKAFMQIPSEIQTSLVELTERIAAGLKVDSKSSRPDTNEE